MDSKTLALSYTRQPMSIYIVKTNIYCVLYAISMMWLTAMFYPSVAQPSFELSLDSLLERLVLAPLLYTCAMIIVFVGLTRYLKRNYYVAFLSAILGATVHIFIAPAFVGVVFTFFFVVSLAYLYWDEHSRGHAVFVTLLLNVFMHFFVVVSAL